jgi:hypothetical protein
LKGELVIAVFSEEIPPESELREKFKFQGSVERRDMYRLEDILKSYRWLGHQGYYTELNAFNPEYKPRDNEWNRKNNAYPKIWYAKSSDEIVQFVKKNHQTHTVCYSINPRSKIFKKESGHVRAAFDSEIDTSQSTFLDFDTEPDHAPLAVFEEFLSRADEYFKDLKINPPVRAYTGRGCHLLFAYSGIPTREYPDISQRLKAFRDQFYAEFNEQIAGLGVRLDRTQDLRRMVKIYGTAKPDVGIVSRFYGSERIEDEGMRDYLLNLSLDSPSKDGIRIGQELPDWFTRLLISDPHVKELWEGTGKPEGTDQSRSGFDYSLMRTLAFLGYKNVDELATILALRPDGSARVNGKPESYIYRTIAKAISK